MQAEPVRIPLYSRHGDVVGYALVDAVDAPAIMPHVWRLRQARRSQGPGYAYRHSKTDGQRYAISMARAVLGLSIDDERAVLGLSIDDEREVDHISGDTLDNRRSNLRALSRICHAQNRPAYRGAVSPYRGVYWHKRKQQWTAEARLNGRKYHIGHFSDEREAAIAAAQWRAQHMPYAVA